MLFQSAALSCFFLMASSAISSVDGFATQASSLIRAYDSSFPRSNPLYSVVEKTDQGRLVSPDDISGADIPLLFEQHVQKTYG